MKRIQSKREAVGCLGAIALMLCGFGLLVATAYIVVAAVAKA